METLLIVDLVIITVACCFMFWWSVLQPAVMRFAEEHEIADFRREISRWDHEQ